jgi:hypothetical protein
MADIDDAVLNDLRGRLQDISLRANRLQEWVELESFVSKLVNSFSRLHEEVRRTAGPTRPVNPANFTADRLTTFQALWQNCETADLLDLEEREKILVFIKQPLALGIGSDTDPQIAEWIANLQQRGVQIGAAIAGLNPPGIVEGCDEFDKSLKRRVNAHRQRVVAEMKALAVKTAELQDRIVANTPAQPGNPGN